MTWPIFVPLLARVRLHSDQRIVALIFDKTLRSAEDRWIGSLELRKLTRSSKVSGRTDGLRNFVHFSPGGSASDVARFAALGCA